MRVRSHTPEENDRDKRVLRLASFRSNTRFFEEALRKEVRFSAALWLEKDLKNQQFVFS